MIKKITTKNLSRIMGITWVSTMIIFVGILYKGSQSEQAIWSQYLGTILIIDIIVGILAFILYVAFNLIASAKVKAKSEIQTRIDPTKCPYCAETIKKEAVKCKHCGEMLSTYNASSVKESRNSKRKSDFIIIALVFGLIVLGISLVDSMAFEGMRQSTATPSSKPTVNTTPVPTTTPKANTTTASKKATNTSQITCIGPDDKQFQATMDECKALNDKWDHPTDYMLNCNIHPDCGGGTEYMAKSQCDKPCSGKIITPTTTTKQTTPTSQLNFYCYDNTLKYSYYTSSGEECNKNNSISLCRGIVKSTYDMCMDNCLYDANSNSSYCIYTIGPSSPEYDACESAKADEYQACMDACAVPYHENSAQCNI